MTKKEKWLSKLNDNPVEWMPKAATRNNDSQISYFKLRMLADLPFFVFSKGVGMYILVKEK